MLDSSKPNLPDEYVERLLKKPTNVFKTKQIYYSLTESGSLSAKLSQPRPLNTEGIDLSYNNNTFSHRIKWPSAMQVISENIQHKNVLPKSKETLYKPSGKEKQPRAFGLSDKGTLVYNYEPVIGRYLEDTKPYGLVVPANSGSGQLTDVLQFESRFESGNLQKAIRTGPNEYELYLRPDLYTTKYTQWFYFRVSNTKKEQTYRFTVVNFYKATSLFSHGMRPLMYSEKAANMSQSGWRRIGENIQYYRTQWNETRNASQTTKTDAHLNNSTHTSCGSTTNVSTDVASKQSRAWYSLTWTFEFPHDDDVVYFASCYPYTYSQLQDYLAEVKLDPYRHRVCKQTELCKTLAGNSVPLLTITEPDVRPKSTVLKTKNDAQLATSDYAVGCETADPVSKQCVVVTARVHPGETQSSWMVQGLLDFLLSKHPDAEVLRANFVFKVVPMLNPDGVIVGNYRCSLAGCDLNRQYTSSLKRFFPTVWHTKEMVLEMMCDYPVLVYCDLHGHSRKQQMFIYGCRSSDPNSRLLDRVFPLMLSRNAPELFNYDKCRFGVQRDKEGTGRIFMWREGIANSYTLEATICGSGGDELTDGYHFNFMDYQQMGHQFCETLLDFCDPDLAKREFVLAELERMRTSTLARKGSGTATSLSDYSSDEMSDSGSDSSIGDSLPAYYTAVLEKKKKKLPKRRSLLQRQQDFGSSSTALASRSTLYERSTQCAACQRETNVDHPGSIFKLHSHGKPDPTKVKKVTDKPCMVKVDPNGLKTRIISPVVPREARWLGERRPSQSCPETPRPLKNNSNETTQDEGAAPSLTDRGQGNEPPPDIKFRVRNRPSEPKKVSWKRTLSAPTRRRLRRQADCNANQTQQSNMQDPVVPSSDTTTNHLTNTCEEGIGSGCALASYATLKSGPRRTGESQCPEGHESRLCFRPINQMTNRFLSLENHWTTRIANKQMRPVNDSVMNRQRNSKELYIRSPEPHCPDFSSLVLTGQSISATPGPRASTDRFTGTAK